MTKDPADEAGGITAKILGGRADGGLVFIMEACAQRARATATRFQWRLTLDGDTWDEDTVTGGELACVERLLAKNGQPSSYLYLNPQAEVWHRSLLLIAHLHKVNGVDLDAAVARVEALSAKELAATIEVYEVPAAPKDLPTSPPS